MNWKKLHLAEERFLEEFPGGFLHPKMVELGKKHKMEKMVALAQESLEEPKFSRPQEMVDSMVKIITRSTMVSLFEKPKFRDFAKSLSVQEREALAWALKEFLYGNEESGFGMLVDVLSLGKLSKWSIISAWGLYLRPQVEVFCKPTTVKSIIKVFEIPDLLYKPKPYYSFYRDFRALIQEMKKRVDPSLSVNNAAFTGFLMMATGTAPGVLNKKP